MTEPTNVVRFRQPDEIDDPLTEVLRAGARHLDAFCHWVLGCKVDRLGVHASVRDRRVVVT